MATQRPATPGEESQGRRSGSRRPVHMHIERDPSNTLRIHFRPPIRRLSSSPIHSPRPNLDVPLSNTARCAFEHRGCPSPSHHQRPGPYQTFPGPAASSRPTRTTRHFQAQSPATMPSTMMSRPRPGHLKALNSEPSNSESEPTRKCVLRRPSRTASQSPRTRTAAVSESESQVHPSPQPQ